MKAIRYKTAKCPTKTSTLIFISLLILFQLSETDDQELPPFPPAKDIKDQNVNPNGGGVPDSGPILPVPHGIRPTLAKYRFEVRIQN